MSHSKLGERLPRLDETHLGLDETHLGHVLVGFQDPGWNLTKHTITHITPTTSRCVPTIWVSRNTDTFPKVNKCFPITTFETTQCTHVVTPAGCKQAEADCTEPSAPTVSTGKPERCHTARKQTHTYESMSTWGARLRLGSKEECLEKCESACMCVFMSLNPFLLSLTNSSYNSPNMRTLTSLSTEQTADYFLKQIKEFCMRTQLFLSRVELNV